jgi:CheY-like chemotaxis protein
MPTTQVRLLIVDDDPGTRFSLCQIFNCMGYDVRGADSGFAALRDMRESVPQILLADLTMEKMSGHELLSIVRRRFPEIYVIAMTGVYLGGNWPEGLPADASYEKATGLAALFQKVKTGCLAGAGSESFRQARRSAPIWVPRHTSAPAEKGPEMIGCPDCLRPFPRGQVGQGAVQEAECIHCRAVVRYAVAVPEYAVR